MYKRIRNITILCLFICAVTVLNSCINLNLNLNSGKNPGKTVITSTAVGDVSVNDKTSFMRNYLLSEEEKLVYDIVYSGMKNKQTTIKFSSLEGYFASESEMKKILSNAVFSVLRDHPELFMYNSGYTYEYNTEFEADSVALKFDFNTEPEKAILMQQQIDKVVNKLIDGINRVIAVPFNKINSMLNTIRSTSILGIQPFKNLWSYNPLSVPKIPKLAKGGIVNRATEAIIGEAGKEAVLPLENNTEWMQELADIINSSGEGEQTINLIVDGERLFRWIVKKMKQKEFAMNGG